MVGIVALIAFFVVKYGMKKKTLPALVWAFIIGSVALFVFQLIAVNSPPARPTPTPVSYVQQRRAMCETLRPFYAAIDKQPASCATQSGFYNWDEYTP